MTKPETRNPNQCPNARMTKFQFLIWSFGFGHPFGFLVSGLVIPRTLSLRVLARVGGGCGPARALRHRRLGLEHRSFGFHFGMLALQSLQPTFAAEFADLTHRFERRA